MSQWSPYTSLSAPEAYPNFGIDATFDPEAPQQVYDDGTLFPSYPHPREDGQEPTLDFSALHDLAQRSAGNVAWQDVIKPSETGPWSTAQTTDIQPGAPLTGDWPPHTPYAQSEPPPTDNSYRGFTDSAYGTSSASQRKNVVHDGRSVVGNETECRSIYSDGRVDASQRNSRGKPPLPPCRDCGREPKNPSDARKHALTHAKPFHCVELDCRRQEGFATNNDLQRHRKSVHKLDPSVGSKSGYICAACPVPEGGQRKFWERKDNFKAHIERRHRGGDADQLLISSKQSKRPADCISVSALAESVMLESHIDRHEISQYQSEVCPSLSRNASQQSVFQGANWPPNSSDEFLPDMIHGFSHFQQTLSSHAENIDYPGPLHPSPNTMTCFDENMIDSHVPFKRQKLDASDCVDLVTELSQTPSLPAAVQLEPSGAASSSTIPELSPALGFTCPKCSRKLRRECDLKKHIKRHTRPYGCTFPRCHRKFGSRNDWKRHESSRHFLQEMWKCEQPRIDGKQCMRRPFHHQESLDKHLRGPEHMLDSMEEITKACKEFRLGREGHHNFWCGFCRQLVKQEEGEQSAWEKRFQHIGDHFDKEGLVSGEWVCIEENIEKKYIPVRHAKEGKRRIRADESVVERELDEYRPDLASMSTSMSASLESIMPLLEYADETEQGHERWG